MNITDIYVSGILNKEEEILKYIKGIYFINGKSDNGIILFTNKRFLFLKKATGFRARGFNVMVYFSWGDIASISTSGLFSKKLQINAKKNEEIEPYTFSCKDITIIAEEIIQNKNKYIENTVIKANTVIIEREKREKADEILKKRLARGEISLEEFHQKIQRT
jgi:hypothetical protein